MDHTELFDASAISSEIENARAAGRAMLAGLDRVLGGDIYLDDFVLLGFIERAQAFHIGVVDMVEQGNPLAAITLLRAYAENLAAVFWIDRHPEDIEKLQLGATKGFRIGRLVAEAERRLPGFKQAYEAWSSAAHPSGAGSFHTLTAGEDRTMTWQSFPRFNSTDDALKVLRWLGQICTLSTQVIQETIDARSDAIRAGSSVK